MTDDALIATTPAGEMKQPRGIYLLFAVEMWERFSYYGMRALLVLYLVDAQHGGMGWDRAPAQRLYGWYGFFAYVLPVLGGAAADRWLGTRRAILIGGLIIAAGHFCLATPIAGTFFAGLVLVVVGTGFFKANVSTMVGQLYRERDPRRDPGFTIYYMGVNTGALLGPLVCGYLAASPHWGWHYGFGAAGVGMVLGLVFYVALRNRYLPGIGLAPTRVASRAGEKVAHARLTREERDRIIALLVIFFFVIFFWTGFEQAGSSMNLFAQERTNRDVFGYLVPAAWFQSLNPVFILLLGPVFAALWVLLARRGREPSTPIKMTAGLAFMALGFVFMVVGAQRNAAGALVSPMWLVAAYLLHTVGELCISPIGLSLVTRLAPVRLGAFFMGMWFLATGIAELVAGQLAALSERIGRGELFHALGGQADFYLVFVVAPLAAAFVLLLFSPWLRRLMHGRDIL